MSRWLMGMTVECYDDCDSFPSDDFIEAFEEA